jgi:pyrroloquinoline quinone (PQQ) biosynthesis protein C
MMQNITLSADADIITQMRLYAKEHNTTVNQIVRDHFSHLLDEKPSRDVLAEKLDRLVEKHADYPEEGWKFDRSEIYLRGE